LSAVWGLRRFRTLNNQFIYTIKPRDELQSKAVIPTISVRIMTVIAYFTNFLSNYPLRMAAEDKMSIRTIDLILSFFNHLSTPAVSTGQIVWIVPMVNLSMERDRDKNNHRSLR